MQVRPLSFDDDLGAELDLSRRAFGPVAAAAVPARHDSVRAAIAAGTIVGAFDGARLTGSARYHVMRQWWHGRAVPMAGVAGVKVAPEERGRGTGTALIARLLGDIAAAGYPLSALYPATAPLYRGFGWEIAGGTYEMVLPARSLAALSPPDPAVSGGDPAGPPVRRAGPGDEEEIVAVLGLVHERLAHCGPATREPWQVRRWLDDPERFAYLAPDGFLAYQWGSPDGTPAVLDTRGIDVLQLVAASPGTARALWRILGSHAPTASTISARVPPGDPVQFLTREPDAVLRRAGPWMLRVTDAPAAIAARGYPAAVSLSAPLELADPALPANAGAWQLEVSGGRGSLERAGTSQAPGALRLGARGLAALYGGTAPGQLRVAGLAAGGDRATDDALAAAFGGQAFLLDAF